MAPSCSRLSWWSSWWRTTCAPTARAAPSTPTSGSHASRRVPTLAMRCIAMVSSWEDRREVYSKSHLSPAMNACMQNCQETTTLSRHLLLCQPIMLLVL